MFLTVTVLASIANSLQRYLLYICMLTMFLTVTAVYHATSNLSRHYSLSHRILRHRHEVLNIDENKN
jgi:hypothetical protein